jgi:hypothetical protein
LVREAQRAFRESLASEDLLVPAGLRGIKEMLDFLVLKAILV